MRPRQDRVTIGCFPVELPLSLVSFCNVAVFLAVQERVPAPLVAFESARAGISTADVLWRRTSVANRLREPYYHRHLFGSGDKAHWNMGTSAGVVGFTRSGSPVAKPFNELRNADGYWDYGVGDVDAALSQTGAQVADVRTLGMLPISVSPTNLDDVLWSYPPGYNGQRRFHERETADGFEVEMQLDNGTAVRWFINPHKGWNAVRIEELHNGVVRRQALVTLAQYGDTWFPSRVEYTAVGAGSLATEEVVSAEFNRPEHPRRLDASHIGLEPGMFVSLPDGHGFWIGDRIAPQDEFDRLLKEGLVRRGPTVEAFMDKHSPHRNGAGRSIGAAADGILAPTGAPGIAATQRVVSPESVGMWEAYTRAHIAHYRLDDGQSQAAFSVLRDCQAQAKQALDARRHDFEALDARRADLEKLPPADRSARERELDQAAARLQEPIRQIFERQLVPRLDRLPTRRQRQAVASQPAERR